MCSALACAPPRAPARRPAHALGGSARPEILPASKGEVVDDGDRQELFGVRSAVLPSAASQLAQRNLDAQAPVVRRKGRPPTAKSLANGDLTLRPWDRIDLKRVATMRPSAVTSIEDHPLVA